MSQLIIDLDDSPELLSQIAGFLQHLGGGPGLAVPQFTDEEVAEGDELIAEPEALARASIQPSAADIFGGVPVAVDTISETTMPVNDVSTSSGTTVIPDDLDSAGYPWDERIHASSKTKNKNGSWKLKRGADKALVTQVRAEHTASPAPTPPVSSAPTPPASSVPTPPGTTTGATPWPTVLQRVSVAQAAGNLDTIKMTEYLNNHGITGGFALLASRPELFDDFMQVMGV